MNSNKNDPKRQRFFGWLDTSAEGRHPKSQNELALQLDVSRLTLKNWEKRRKEYDVLPVKEIINKLGEKLDLTLADIEQLIKTGTKEQKVQKAKDILLYIGLKEKKFQPLVEYLKTEGEYIVKTEETHKYDLTEEDRAEIIRLIGELQRDFSEGTGGKDILSAESPLLLE